MLHGFCFREEAGARNLVLFKWLQPAMKRSSCVCGGCGWGRSDIFSLPQRNGGFKLLWTRYHRLVWNLLLQIAVHGMVA